jgi:hypothetical protein
LQAEACPTLLAEAGTTKEGEAGTKDVTGVRRYSSASSILAVKM